MSLVNVKITREIDDFCGLIYFSVKILPFTRARYERKFPCETIVQLSINLWDRRIKSIMAGNSNSRKIYQHEINAVFFFALLNFRNATVATTARCQQTSVSNSRTKGSQAAGIKEKPQPSSRNIHLKHTHETVILISCDKHLIILFYQPKWKHYGGTVKWGHHANVLKWDGLGSEKKLLTANLKLLKPSTLSHDALGSFRLLKRRMQNAIMTKSVWNKSANWITLENSKRGRNRDRQTAKVRDTPRKGRRDLCRKKAEIKTETETIRHTEPEPVADRDRNRERDENRKIKRLSQIGTDKQNQKQHPWMRDKDRYRE